MTSWKNARLLIGQGLADEAAWVLQELEDADALGLPIREDAITSLVLLHLCRRLGPDLLKVATFTPNIEGSTTGADWEWWFGDGLGTPYFGMRVQAKKLQHSSLGPWYDFSYQTKSTKKLQIETFQESADLAGLPAIYALYNGTFRLTDFRWACCEPAFKPLFGVSILSATVADSLRIAGTTTLADVGPHSRPWSCSMRCPQWLSGGPVPMPFGESPGTGLTFASDLIGSLIDADHLRSEFGDDSQDGSAEISNAVRSWDLLPGYVRRLVENEEASNGNEIDALRPQRLGGVAVFSVIE